MTTEGPPEERQRDWEPELTPERELLKEYTSFVDSVAQTVAVSENPLPRVSGLLQGWLAKHAAELPADELQTLERRLEDLQRRSAEVRATQQ